MLTHKWDMNHCSMPDSRSQPFFRIEIDLFYRFVSRIGFSRPTGRNQGRLKDAKRDSPVLGIYTGPAQSAWPTWLGYNCRHP
jgi:hypothetical protein